eukprot:scaffold12.g7975.t1
MLKAFGSVLRGLGRGLDSLGSSIQGGMAYKETLNKAKTVMELGAKKPVLGDAVFVAPSASVIGDVKLGPGSSVWYGAVVRGDVNSVTVGEKTNIQDNAIIHVAKHNAHGKLLPTIIGNSDCCVVGMGATVMDGAVVEKGAIVGAGALVPPGTVIPSGQIWAGSPAKLMRELAEGELAFIAESADSYSQLAAVHAAENAKSFDEIELDAARRADRLERDPDLDDQQGVERDPVTREVVGVAAST